jgi:outer membrane protein OmpA-like peptidoglycan-associated protein
MNSIVEKNIMKTLSIAICVLLSVNLLHAQTDNGSPQEMLPQDSSKVKDYCPHRINVYLGGSYANNIYNRVKDDFANTNYSFGSILEIKYAYFFTKQWGISIGAGISNYTSKATLNFSGVIPHYNDPDFDPGVYPEERFYDLHYKGRDLREKQVMWALEVPLMVQFEHKFDSRKGIYAGLGAKFFFPFLTKSYFTGEGSIYTEGYEEFTDYWYTNLDDPFRFGDRVVNTTSAKVKMRPSADITADFGGIFTLSNAVDLYVGIYGSYGFLDILPKSENKTDFIANTAANPQTINSTLASNFLPDYNAYADNQGLKKVSEKWNLWQAGIKIGIHIKTCRDCTPTKQERLAKEEQFREDMLQQKQEGIIVRDTVRPEPEPVDTNIWTKKEVKHEPTPEELANRDALIAALSKLKILFDLDMDIPKITDKGNHIDKIAEIVKADPSLTLQIEGYTCDLGKEEHNKDLAHRRAEAVRLIFLEKGVNASQIKCVGYTYGDQHNKENITSKKREEHRACLCRILK